MNLIEILQNITHKGNPHYKGSTVDADVHLQDADLESLAARGLIKLNATPTSQATEVKPEATATQTEEVKPQEPVTPETQTQEENNVEEQKEGEHNGEQEQAETGKEETQEEQK